MKYFISGASGFIGQWLTNCLEMQGETVIAIPRKFLAEPTTLRGFMHQQKPDVIIHLASYGNMRGQIEPTEIFKANVLATWHMLTASQDLPYTAFLNISSSSVYGDKFTPMNETDTLTTRTFYGATKVSGEYLARAFVHTFDKPIVTIRPFSVYGEGEADYRFIPTMCRALVTGEGVKLHLGPPHDWIHVDDFCRLTREVIKHIGVLKGESVNMGTGVQTENVDIVRILKEISGKDIHISETIEGDNHEWVMGRGVLSDWKLATQIPLYEGLKRCWKYYKHKYEKRDKEN